MKLRFGASLLLLAAMFIISCSKDDAKPNDQTKNTESLFVRMQQGLLPEDDTVYHISYDANKRITSVVDSVDADTSTVTYNNAGYPGTLVYKYDVYSENTTFNYNTDNQLTEINYNADGYKEQYVFEYTNGVISKKSYYDNAALGGSTLSLWRYYTYVVTNGNITSMKEYDKVGNLVSETTYTYNSDTNVFKPITLFNYGNRLGLDDVANYETFTNKNLIATSSIGDVQTTYTYTYNSNKQLTKFVVSSPDAIYTRMLGY